MKCGVRFCGGCNPRYDRGQALKALTEELKGDVDFVIAKENVMHDLLVVIGGCTNCCASYEQFQSKEGVIKMWDEEQLVNISKAIKDLKF